MNIVRVSPREYALEFSRNDTNIKIKKDYRDSKELDKRKIVKLDKESYIEWSIQLSKYNDFFTSLLFCAENGFFEKDNIEEVKNILENSAIPLGQKFLTEKLNGKEDSGDVLDELDNIYLKHESKKGIDFLFRSQVVLNNKDIIFRVAFDEENQIILSVFFYVLKIHFNSESKQSFPVHNELMTLWLDICKIFLYVSVKTHAAITDKLDEIEPIINEIENQRENIKDSFGLDLSKFLVSKDTGTENAYTIRPIGNNKKTLINTIENPDAFNQYNLTFERCIFNEFIFKTMEFTKKIHFLKCIFKQIVNFEESEFQEKVSFEYAIFKEDTSFSFVQFHKDVYFSKSTFKKLTLFVETIFHNNAFFGDTRFEDEVSFQMGEFHKDAQFYGAIFQKFPIFIQTIFNKNINFTNTELNIKFDTTREKINKFYNDNKKEHKELKKYKIANEFRDSFRNIKSALIKDNNMLDASNYHRMELYCKEIELEYKIDEKAKDSGVRDIADKIQLMFYRLTSDHHTDLLLILNNVLGLIILFSLLVLMLFHIATQHIEYVYVENIDINYCQFKDMYYLSSILPKFLYEYYDFSNPAWDEICRIVAACLLFILEFVFVMSCFHINFIRKHLGFCFIVLCVPTAIILVVKPAIILPIFGKLIDESLKVDFPAFTSLSIIYAILMFLLIFSLQKTARKNTIVPS